MKISYRPCPQCGKPKVPKHRAPLAICERCAGRSRNVDWPEMSRKLIERTMPKEVVCPHCVGVSGTCCACRAKRKISFESLLAAMRYVWARDGCGCNACQRAREQEAVITPPVVQLFGVRRIA